MLPNARGRRAEGIEVLRSSGYRYLWQREAEGALVTVYLPSLLSLDPGMVDPSGARFVVLPSSDWARAQRVDAASMLAHAVSLGFDVEKLDPQTVGAVALLFAAYLDRRTRAPLLADPRFYMQLMLACLRDGLASWSVDRYGPSWGREEFGRHQRLKFREEGTARAGLLPGIAFHADHPTIEELLSREVERFFEIVGDASQEAAA
jgi:hypothetical protein